MCHKWPRICSTCHKHLPVFFLFMTYHRVRVTRSLVFDLMFCRSLFVLLYFFMWPLYCPFFFDLRILITLLVSSNSPWKKAIWSGGGSEWLISIYIYNIKMLTFNFKSYLQNSMLWSIIFMKLVTFVYLNHCVYRITYV